MGDDNRAIADRAVTEADYLEEYAERNGVDNFDWAACMAAFLTTTQPETLRRTYIATILAAAEQSA